ncbi:V-set and immunoglobulin domain-containing protein 1 [Tiliqua scincoides]|uniref:V-set and immunoglobulin domain-containing protein 1 n=1 Tax=Tiliqua scincoides TaxID=71010 RepID=UPI0034628820
MTALGWLSPGKQKPARASGPERPLPSSPALQAAAGMGAPPPPSGALRRGRCSGRQHPPSPRCRPPRGGPVSCLTVAVPVRSVNTTVGGNITLVCTYTTSIAPSNLAIEWSFYSRKQMGIKLIYYSTGSQSYSYGEFKGRIQGVNTTGTATITIFNMQPSDTGVYACEVFNPAEGQSSKSIAVSVLAPPSQLQCGFSTSPEIGHNIALSCSAKIGLPPPTYVWHRVSGDTVKPVTESYNSQTGLFVIGNLTSFEEGYYQCTAMNSLGNTTCQTDVTMKHSESGIIVGALIGAILAAALICGIVWFLTSREKKKKRNEKIAASGMQTVAQKEPLTSEYVAVPSQEAAPVVSAPPSKESNETREYVAPEESEVVEEPENQIQILEHQPVA